MTTVTTKEWRDDHHGHRPARRTARAEAVRHAGDPGRPPRHRRLQPRLHPAEFEQQVTLEEFDFAASPRLPAARIRDLAALRWLRTGESVIPFGPVGVGKTHVAQALGHLAIRQGANLRFAKTSQVLADLAGGHADRAWDRRLRELVRPNVLILADCASWYVPTCSSSPTSRRADSPPPRPTTSTNGSASGRAGP
ncbi:ATP-binding protein [Streptomyces spinoverrucosus]|uniref:ATP-binding protein n=1 Tax=Streptomyces spinoverrucosus TaxID=284043 RepID=UPI0027DA8BDB|nr:ATP-binding protein [Streptomyces spinoverrucosus]